MCRNIKTLYNFDPPATEEELHEASIQFVRKISGFVKPSKINEDAFDEAVQNITLDIRKLINSLSTNSPSRNREEVTAKLQAKAHKRFGIKV